MRNGKLYSKGQAPMPPAPSGEFVHWYLGCLLGWRNRGLVSWEFGVAVCLFSHSFGAGFEVFWDASLVSFRALDAAWSLGAPQEGAQEAFLVQFGPHLGSLWGPYVGCLGWLVGA